MGGGSFSSDVYRSISFNKGYETKTNAQIFKSRKIHPSMDPTKMEFRESLDSDEHPETVPIIIALDVTGSMGQIPNDLVKNSFPLLMDTIIQNGIKHPQVLFMGIGDFVYDDAPLQVGQFESSTELLDKWLTSVYLEGGGGGNNYETYSLAWLAASRHTKIDSLKRGKKGFLFTIGDEPLNPEIPADVIMRLTTEKQASTISSSDLYKEVSEKYEVFHIHVEHGRNCDLTLWKDILGQRVLKVGPSDVAKVIADTVVANYSKNSSAEVVDAFSRVEKETVEVEEML